MLLWRVVLSIILAGCSPFGDSSTDPQFHPGLPSQTPVEFSALLSLSDGETYDYGGVTVGGSSNKTFTLTNSGNKAARSLSANSLTSEFSFVGGNFPGTGGTCSSELDGGSSCTLVVSFAPTTSGTKSDTLTISSDDPTATRPLLGSGLTAASLTISDGATYNFGNVGANGTSSKTFTLTNFGQSTATSLSGTAPSSPFSFPSGFPGGGTCTTALSGGGSCTFVVSVSPTGYGSLAETIAVTYNNGLSATSATRDVIANGVGLAGTLDTSFNGPGVGRVTTAIGTNSDIIFGVQIQGDGKIVAAGQANTGAVSDFGMARYLSTGALDTSFNTTGKLMQSFGTGLDVFYALQIQTDGKAVAAGTARGSTTNFDIALARYDSSGSLDTSFNTTGKIMTTIGTNAEQAAALGIQTDGKLIVAGDYTNASGLQNFALVRYFESGDLDTTFNTNGKVTITFGTNSEQAAALIIQTDGNIIAAGSTMDNTSRMRFALGRYLSDGTLDTSFNTNGKVVTEIGTNQDSILGLQFQTDGKILAGGYAWAPSGGDFGVARYLSNGILDTSFNTTGMLSKSIGATNDLGYALILQTDGKSIVGGYYTNASNTYNFALFRLLPSGAFDTSFNSTGILATSLSTVGGFTGDVLRAFALQSDGMILGAGSSRIGSTNDFAIYRIWP